MIVSKRALSTSLVNWVRELLRCAVLVVPSNRTIATTGALALHFAIWWTIVNFLSHDDPAQLRCSCACLQPRAGRSISARTESGFFNSTAFERVNDMRYDRVASQDPATEAQNDNRAETAVSPDSWKALFHFSRAKHIPISCAAIGASSLAGLTQPATALLLGKVFDTFTSYAAQKVDDETFKALLSAYCTYLIALAAAAWLIDGLFLSTWMIFGDLQAQSAHERVFATLLQKELSWFDMRETGTGALLSETQM